MPLVITHGWPGSVVEFHKVIEPLTDPTAHGGNAADAFHVVCPSLPGFGFSEKPKTTGWGVDRIASSWAVLMDRLGYKRYGAQGLSFLGISVDDPVEELKPFVDQYKMNYPVLVGLGREEVQEAYGPMMGIPVTVVVGRDGNLCTRYFGLRPKDRFESDIKSLL